MTQDQRQAIEEASDKLSRNNLPSLHTLVCALDDMVHVYERMVKNCEGGAYWERDPRAAKAKMLLRDMAAATAD